MFEFIEETFQPDNTGEKILSIQASLNGFSFSIICPDQKKLLCFRAAKLKISSERLLSRHFESWFSQEPLLQNNFKKVSVVFHSTKFTLVPNHLYSKQKIVELTSMLFENTSQQFWNNNASDTLNSQLLFAVPKEFQEKINKLLPTAEIIHPVKLLLDKGNSSEQKRMELLFGSNHFSLVLFKDQQLEMINNFSFNHPNDIIFYVLSVLRQLNIGSKEVYLGYAGEIDIFTQTEKLLQDHFPLSNRITPSITTPPFIKDHITQNISLFLQVS